MTTHAASSTILPHNSMGSQGQLPNSTFSQGQTPSSTFPQAPNQGQLPNNTFPQIQPLNQGTPQNQSTPQPPYYQPQQEGTFATPVAMMQPPYNSVIAADPTGLRRSMGQDPMDTSNNRVIPVVPSVRDQALFNSYPLLDPSTQFQHPSRTYPHQPYLSEQYQLRPHTAPQTPLKLILRSEPINPINWMSQTSFCLKDLKILGTHNSGFYMGELRSQRLDISEQLKCGVRFLDLALVQYYDEIYLYQFKPIFELQCPYITLSEVLWCVRLFLEENVNEIIFINLRTIESDIIDELLLELKFKVINKFIFDINEINLDVTPSELISDKRKNIILFSTDAKCFSFLWAKNLTLGISQIEEFKILNDLTNTLKKFWNKPKNNFAKSKPLDLRFSRFLIDSVGYEVDADELFSVWNSSLVAVTVPRFYFFTLCRVNSRTWKKFSSLMHAYYTY